MISSRAKFVGVRHFSCGNCCAEFSYPGPLEGGYLMREKELRVYIKEQIGAGHSTTEERRALAALEAT